MSLANLLTVRMMKLLVRFWPPYAATGIRVTRISEDVREVDVSMKLRWYNRNGVGSHFGGSLYSMADPFYMLMLIRNLGLDYYVWDKAASIEYVKPGTTEVFARFRLTDNDIHEAVSKARDGQPHYMQFSVDVVDTDGEAVARVKKTVYVRLKKSARLRTTGSAQS